MTGGGIKGAVAAACCGRGEEFVFFHVNYGQPSANAERNAIQALCASLPVAHLVGVDMPHVGQISKRLEEQREPVAPAGERDRSEAHASTPALQGLMPVFILAAGQCAMQVGALRVVVGLSQHVSAEHLGLPTADGRPDRPRELLHALSFVFEIIAPQGPGALIEYPLIDRTYEEIIKLADHFTVPLEHTWSCGRSGPRPCGRCARCAARAEAFAAARLGDPLSSTVPNSV